MRILIKIIPPEEFDSPAVEFIIPLEAKEYLRKEFSPEVIEKGFQAEIRIVRNDQKNEEVESVFFVTLEEACGYIYQMVYEGAFSEI